MLHWRTKLVAFRRSPLSDIYGGRAVEMHAAMYDGEKYTRVSEIVTVPLEADGVDHAPFLTLGIDEAQLLMDSLWDCGVRPTGGSGSAGAMAAVQEHLKDLRADKIFLQGLAGHGAV